MPDQPDADVIVIDLEEADPSFQDEVARRRGAERIKLCYACGACGARCPVQDQNPDFDPRRLIRMVVLGLWQELLTGPLIWLCAACYTCQETCPEKVGFTEAVFALKNMAVEAGHFPPTMAAQPELLRRHGRLYEITDFENQKRTELDLPRIEEKPEHFQVLLDCLQIKAGEKT
ncbi:MAG: 4Fe-4S dicluster domain-containing protein [Thermodesulfobacteriota bacterium]